MSSQVHKYATTVLSAMMSGMDDKDDVDGSITLEAMEGLSKIITKIDETHVRSILINIALKIRPCFEKVILDTSLPPLKKQRYCNIH